MSHDREIALPCQIYAGGFSGERIARIVLADGSTQEVLAPRHYCWNKAGEPLVLEEPRLGESLEGMVAARRIQTLPNGSVIVTTPDGEVFAVSAQIVRPRPRKSEISSNVPV
jgi:hypothetical protein